MADTKTEAKEQLNEQESATITDAPKKGAVPGEQSHIEQDFDDLGSAVVSPVDARKGPSDANKDNKAVKQVVNAKALPGHQTANDDTEAGVQKADEPSDEDGTQTSAFQSTGVTLTNMLSLRRAMAEIAPGLPVIVTIPSALGTDTVM